MRYLIIIILLFSCSYQREFKVDKELKVYVDSFFDLAMNKGLLIQKENLIVTLSANIGSLQGLSSKKNGQRIVEINYYNYQNYSSDYIEAIVFHELGHALLNRGHDDSVESLMNTSVCLSCYSNNKEYLIKELFK
jgi:Zn-dependent peptidase ImmA (M78 family)